MFSDVVCSIPGMVSEHDVNPAALRVIDRFLEGYECGFTWSDEWGHQNVGEPGGPWIYRGSDENKKEQSDLENRMWRQGWRQGQIAALF